jgi:hypothetical protein
MAATELRKMLVVSPEQLERLRGEKQKVKEKELRSEMNSASDWDSYRILLQKFMDFKKEEREKKIHLPIFEVKRGEDDPPPPSPVKREAPDHPRVKTEKGREEEEEVSGGRAARHAPPRPAPAPAPASASAHATLLHRPPPKGEDDAAKQLHAVPVYAHRMSPDFNYENDEIPPVLRREEVGEDVSLESMLDIISRSVLGGGDHESSNSSSGGTDNDDDEFFHATTSTPITPPPPPPPPPVSGSTSPRESANSNHSSPHIRHLRFGRTFRWTPLQLEPRSRHRRGRDGGN